MRFPLSRLYDESATNGVTSDSESSASSAIESTPSSGDQVSSQTETTSDANGGAPELAPTPSAPPSPPSWFDTFKSEHGIDFSTKYKDEAELRKGLVNAAKLVGQRDEYAELGRLYAQYGDQFRQFINSQQNSQPAQGYAPPQQQQQPEGWWNPPEWNDAWNKYIDPETQSLRDDTPLEIRRRAEERLDYIDRWRHNLSTNPMKAFEPIYQDLENRIIQKVQADIQQRVHLNQQHVEADQLVASARDWIYQTHDGQILTDELGRKLFTPAGAMMVEELQLLANAGVRDQRLAFDIAQLRVKERLGTLSPATAAVPPRAKAQPNNNAGKSPNGKQVSGGKGKSLKDRLANALADVPDHEFSM